MIKQLFNLPLLKVENIEYTDSYIKISASIRSKRSKCPSCGKYSHSVHDYYHRSVTDLPVFQNKSTIRLKTRKFKCKNPACKQKVFSEQVSDISKYSRRTQRATNILDSLSIELTGNQGSIVSNQLSIGVSNSTITRIAHKQKLPEIKQPKILGVDDWAYRKGVSYGTVLVDMETSRPIDILESREGKDLKVWLDKYKDVKIITRDRASSYSSAINDICPNAIQVADRFHLLMNLSEALDRYFKSINNKIRTVIKLKQEELTTTDTEVNADDCEKESKIVTKNIRQFRVDQRLSVFNKVKEFQKQRIPIKTIARNMGISRITVRSYFSQEYLSPKSHPQATNIELFTDHIVYLLSQRTHTIKNIINEIKKLGFRGGKSQAYANIKAIRELHNIPVPEKPDFQKPIKLKYVKPLSHRKLTQYIGMSFSDIESISERKYMKTLLENLPELRIVRKLVIMFRTMLKRGAGNIRRWIHFIKKSKYKLSGLKTLANGISRDIDAVENGISMKWSNGAVEGHVNRIKSIKRQMYGRAGFELLRKKIILSKTG